MILYTTGAVSNDCHVLTTWYSTNDVTSTADTVCIYYQRDFPHRPESAALGKGLRHWRSWFATRCEQVATEDCALRLSPKSAPALVQVLAPFQQLPHLQRAHRRANPVPNHPRAAIRAQTEARQ